MPSNFLASLLRTFVPIIVGYLLGLPVARVLGVSSDDATGLVTAILTAVYYAAVRALEQYVPAAGWLLGYASTPAYAPPVADGTA